MTTILIADDEKDIRMLTAIALREKFEVVIEASNAQEAVAMAHEHHPDLILMDVRMPGDGLEACQELTEAEDTKDIPIVFISAMVSKEDIERGLGVGAVDYIRKPFCIFELPVRLEAILAERGK